MERLQRVIAARGISSRRSAEELITSGRVLVNGVAVTELGTKVDTTADEIRVDGKVLRPQRLRTILLNKPAGYITTMHDERERRTVMELVQTRERLFPVGRLDRDTEGLLLLTNDGELANRIMHPRYRLAKEYHVLTNARPTDRTLQYLRDGVRIDARDVVPDEIRLLRESREGIWIRIVIHEGFYHAVRRIMEAANIDVLKLRRHRIGPISIQGLETGLSRDLTAGELSQISEAVHLDRDAERTATITEPAGPVVVTRRGARAGRGRLVSVRPGDDQPAPGAVRWDGSGRFDRSGGERVPVRPAARTRTPREEPADPPRSPIVERPGAWSARRPENPAPARGARPPERPLTPAPPASPPAIESAPPTPPAPTGEGRFETVGGRRFSDVQRTYRPEPRASGDQARRPVRRPAPQRPRRDDGGPVTTPRTGTPRTGSPAPGHLAAGSPASSRSGRPAEGRTPDRREDVQRRPDRPSTPTRIAEGDRRSDRPAAADRRPAERSDDRRPSRPGEGPRRPDNDRNRQGPRPDRAGQTDRRIRNLDDDGPRGDTSGPAGRRPFPDRSGRPPQRRPDRRPDGAGAAGRTLDTIGRVSRKVASDDPNGTPTRVKRRSPHSHSHRGAKPKPAAPRINTTKVRHSTTTKGKGNRRGRRP